jgi:hypothetical protein
MTSVDRAITAPSLDLRAQYLGSKRNVDAAIRRVVNSQHFILAPRVRPMRIAGRPDLFI